MENQELMVQTLENRTKLPIEIKKSMLFNMLFNLAMNICMIVLTVIINIAFKKLLFDFNNYIKVFQIALAIIIVVLFEVSYRRDSMKIGVYAIEFFIYGIGILFIQYMYMIKGNIKYINYVMILFTVYYFIKSIVTVILIRFNYLKDNISDVKEIVKDEKKSYLDEESHKTLKDKKRVESVGK